MHDHTRPDPDALLRSLEEQQLQSSKGRLKVFLGYAPRVGKSVRMFEEGRRRARRGQDVIVGAVQSEVGPETEALIAGLETIPSHRPGLLDVPAILRRRPQVCIVDELAFENPPGSAHAHRWEDVAELVNSGLTVITALNIQYIAEQQEAVETITGRRASCSVPASFLRIADEIVLVDVPSDGLPAGTGQLNEEQLSRLRSLGLVVSAEVVEEQLLRYMTEHGIHKSWGTQERILVCVTPRSQAREMLDSAAHVAKRFHAHFAVLHVRGSDPSRADEEAVQERLEYARKLSATAHVLECSGDPVQQIIDFARAERITQLFIGHTQRKPWAFWKNNPVDRLIEAAEGMDVRIFPST